ncbi:MAG TPA: hypothetical protein VME17_00635 [Bryobacteraceae bacterium]|nr:hypothetical protein [Bryobacteraceae bacterium]
MKHLISGLTLFTVLALGECIAADNGGVIAITPVHTVTAEAGVAPAGTSLVVRSKDTVKTRRAYRGTVYFANTAADILDQSGAVLIPSGSPIELAVHSLAHLGAGGAGMRWIGGEETSRHAVTGGQKIDVPADTLLAFQIQAPIRLRGYQR